MSFTTRLCAFALVAIAGLIAWQWSVATESSRDLTQLAVLQFQNNDAVAERLRLESLQQNGWPLLALVLLAILACVMFWDDLERWWTKDVGEEKRPSLPAPLPEGDGRDDKENHA